MITHTEYLKELGININNYWLNNEYEKDIEYYNLDMYMILEVYCHLRYFQDNCGGAPTEFPQEEWDNILNQMIAAFKIMAIEDNELEIYLYPDNRKKKKCFEDEEVKKGLELFYKYFYYLWK